MKDVRDYIAGFRKAFEQRARLLAPLSDRSVSLRAQLNRVWRDLRVIIADGDEWLSWRSESLQDIRSRRLITERRTLAEKFHHRLHALHGIGRSSALGCGMLVAPAGVSIAVGAAFAGAEASDRVSSLAGTLVAVSEVLGGAAGILFAVIVFGIQYHGEKLDKAAFLVRYLRRREGLIPIAAFTLGVVAANVVVSLACSLGLSYAAVPMAIVDLFLVPGVLWLVLWLLYRMTASVSEDFVTLVTPSLTWEYDRAMDEDIHQARQFKVFENAVEEAGLQYSTVGAFASSLDRAPSMEIILSGRGFIADVNLTKLKSLGEFIRSKCPGQNAKLCVGPADSVDNTVALVLMTASDDRKRTEDEHKAPDHGVVDGLRGMLRAVYRLGSARKHDVVGVLSMFEEMLVEYARDESVKKLESGLKIQEELVRHGMAREDAAQAHFSIHRDRLPDYLGTFEYHDMAQAVVSSDNIEKIKALLLFAFRIMALAIGHCEAVLFKRAGDIWADVYVLTRDREQLDEAVGVNLDNWLHYILGHFKSRRASRLDPEKIRAEMPVLLTALGWILRLIKQAMEANCREHAGHFHSRLFEWDKYQDIRHRSVIKGESLSPELQEVLDLHTYADLVIGAWSFGRIGTSASKNKVALGVFSSAMSELPSRQDLLRVWEWVQSRQFDGAPINDRLGVTRWSQEGGSYRAGTHTFFYGEPDTWVLDGFVALLLARPSASKHVRMPFLSQPPSGAALLEVDSLKSKATRLLSDDWVRKEVLRISDEKKDATLSAVTQLIASRQCRHKHARLKEVVDGNVSGRRKEVLRREILDALPEKRDLYKTLMELAAPKNPATAWFIPIRVRVDVWRDRLLESSRGATGFGHVIAESVADEESKRIAFGAEKLAKVVGRISALAEFPRAIEIAAKELSGRGYSPSMIIIPREERFIRALSGASAWELPNRRTKGRFHLGTWQHYEIVECPYTNARSIVVLDPGDFFGGAADDLESALSLDVTEPSVETHRQSVAAAESEDDPSKIPDAHDICVASIVRLTLGIGVRNHEAAVRVALDLTRLGFAMQQSDSLYHRPSCGLLNTSSGVPEYSLHVQMAGEADLRAPCEQCEPEKWGDEREPDSDTGEAR